MVGEKLEADGLKMTGKAHRVTADEAPDFPSGYSTTAGQPEEGSNSSHNLQAK